MNTPAKRLICVALFLIANLVYCERVASGAVGSDIAGAWGALAVLWVAKIATSRPREHRRRVR
jgi:hypothetical protein